MKSKHLCHDVFLPSPITWPPHWAPSACAGERSRAVTQSPCRVHSLVLPHYTWRSAWSLQARLCNSMGTLKTLGLTFSASWCQNFRDCHISWPGNPFLGSEQETAREAWGSGLLILSASRVLGLYSQVMAVDLVWQRVVAGQRPACCWQLWASFCCGGSAKSSRAGVSICKLAATCSWNEKLMCLCSDQIMLYS